MVKKKKTRRKGELGTFTLISQVFLLFAFLQLLPPQTQLGKVVQLLLHCRRRRRHHLILIKIRKNSMGSASRAAAAGTPFHPVNLNMQRQGEESKGKWFSFILKDYVATCKTSNILNVYIYAYIVWLSFFSPTLLSIYQPGCLTFSSNSYSLPPKVQTDEIIPLESFKSEQSEKPSCALEIIAKKRLMFAQHWPTFGRAF